MERLTYVYQCWARSGKLLYVGITSDLSRRKQQHAEGKFWWSEVAKITSRAFPREIEARWAEWALIVTERPTYNNSSPTPKTPDLGEVEPVVMREVVRETLPEFVVRVSAPLRRWWRAIPTAYAITYGFTAAVLILFWLDYRNGGGLWHG